MKILFPCISGSLQSNNPNLLPPNLTNNPANVLNPNINAQFLQNPNLQNPNYNPYLHNQQNYGQIGANGGIGILVSIIPKKRFYYEKKCLDFLSVLRLTMHLSYNHVQ